MCEIIFNIQVYLYIVTYDLMFTVIYVTLIVFKSIKVIQYVIYNYFVSRGAFILVLIISGLL